MHDKRKNPRVYVIFFITFFSFLLILTRLFYIQIISHDKLSSIAGNQYNKIVEIPADRGKIFDRNYRSLALTLPSYSLYADPSKINDNVLYAGKLSEILDIKHDIIEDKLKRPKYFVWIKRHLTKEEREKVESLNFKGLGFIKEKSRFYPNDNLVSHIIGYTGIDTQGLAGLEFSFDKQLKGLNGYKYINVDAIQRELTHLEKNFVKSHKGYDLVLTIDEVMQYIAREALNKAVKKYNALGGAIIVMNPFTGEILAMSSVPDFNPNNYKEYDDYYFCNKAISSVVEPGSVFKIVTAAGILEEGLLKEDSEKIYCENGAYKVYSHVLHDYHPYGYLTFPEILIHSSNIGIAKLAGKLGEQKLYKYIKLFGFGESLGIELPGEEAGLLKKPENWSKLSIFSIPMGHEIGVTVLQIACAFSVVANGGRLMKPYIVKKTEINGQTIRKFKPFAKRRVISEENADVLKKILTRVVDEGTGRNAVIENVKVAGKTGTAQKIGFDGKYSNSKYIASFAGFLPSDNPEIVIVVMLDEPYPIYFGGVTSAPVFKETAAGILSYIKSQNLQLGKWPK